MYSYCTIRWIDDGRTENVIIKHNEDVDPREDDGIFFYGLAPNEIDRLIASGEAVSGEFVILARG